MYRRNRTRGSQGQWFPTKQTTEGTVITVPAGATGASLITPIIADNWDQPPNEATMAVQGSRGLLAAALGGGYLVKRIVGSIFASVSTGDSEDFIHRGFIVSAGIFTDRTDTNGNLLNAAAWNPFIDAAAQKRWLWRRVWRLGGHWEPVPGNDLITWPTNNTQYGSLREGTHIDSKVKARVTYEERLFLGIWATNCYPTEIHGGYVDVCFNLRMFAKQLRADNR